MIVFDKNNFIHRIIILMLAAGISLCFAITFLLYREYNVNNINQQMEYLSNIQALINNVKNIFLINNINHVELDQKIAAFDKSLQKYKKNINNNFHSIAFHSYTNINDFNKIINQQNENIQFLHTNLVNIKNFKLDLENIINKNLKDIKYYFFNVLVGNYSDLYEFDLEIIEDINLLQNNTYIILNNIFNTDIALDKYYKTIEKYIQSIKVNIQKQEKHLAMYGGNRSILNINEIESKVNLLQNNYKNIGKNLVNVEKFKKNVDLFNAANISIQEQSNNFINYYKKVNNSIFLSISVIYILFIISITFLVLLCREVIIEDKNIAKNKLAVNEDEINRHNIADIEEILLKLDIGDINWIYDYPIHEKPVLINLLINHIKSYEETLKNNDQCSSTSMGQSILENKQIVQELSQLNSEFKNIYHELDCKYSDILDYFKKHKLNCKNVAYKMQNITINTEDTKKLNNNLADINNDIVIKINKIKQDVLNLLLLTNKKLDTNSFKLAVDELWNMINCFEQLLSDKDNQNDFHNYVNDIKKYVNFEISELESHEDTLRIISNLKLQVKSHLHKIEDYFIENKINNDIDNDNIIKEA